MSERVRLVPIRESQLRGLERSWLAEAWEDGITEEENADGAMYAPDPNDVVGESGRRFFAKLEAAFQPRTKP